MDRLSRIAVEVGFNQGILGPFQGGLEGELLVDGSRDDDDGNDGSDVVNQQENLDAPALGLGQIEEDDVGGLVFKVFQDHRKASRGGPTDDVHVADFRDHAFPKEGSLPNCFPRSKRLFLVFPKQSPAGGY
jgi:hypothetical protein